MNYFQQGDVLLKPVSSEPKEAKVKKTDLLWKGQSHHHRLKGKYRILTDGNVTYVRSTGCTLFHEEHKEIKIPKGLYELGIVMEYDHLTEESRRVID